jgi:hypothetical protein
MSKLRGLEPKIIGPGPSKLLQKIAVLTNYLVRKVDFNVQSIVG